MSDSDSSSSEVEVNVEKPKKVTIPASERKKACTSKALEALALKRKTQKDDKKKTEKKIKAVQALAERVVDTEAPLKPAAVVQPTINVDEIKRQLKEELQREAEQKKANKIQKKKKIVLPESSESESESEEEEVKPKSRKQKTPKAHHQVAQIPQQVVPVYRSGSDLLDELFFGKRR
jgi:hypothetical protein